MPERTTSLFTRDSTAVLFLLLPILFTFLSFFYFTYPLDEDVISLLSIPLFASLALLLIGFIFKQSSWGGIARILGWLLFAFYWATQAQTLYYAEQEDLFNAAVCLIGLYVLSYFAYHEWDALRKKETISCLYWLAGAAAISGLIYFTIELTPLATMLIDVVCEQSGWLLNVFTGGVIIDPPHIQYKEAYITIIFACTAVQSMVLFVGMILPLSSVPLSRRIKGVLVTVVPVYFLNLIRNASIVYLVGVNGPDFFGMAHNIIGKGGSLLALILLLFIVIKIVPELFDEILSIADLPKRNAPIEQYLKNMLGK